MRQTPHPTRSIHTRSGSRRRLVGAATAALATASLLLAACGGQSDSAGSPTVPTLAPGTNQPAGDGEGTPEAPADPDEAGALYMKCMQDAGFSMKVDAETPDPEEFTAADQECQKHMANVVNEFELDPEEVAKNKDLAIAYAKCMQGAGFDVQAAPEGGIVAPIDLSSKDGYEEADEKCGADLRAASEEQTDGDNVVQP